MGWGGCMLDKQSLPTCAMVWVGVGGVTEPRRSKLQFWPVFFCRSPGDHFCARTGGHLFNIVPWAEGVGWGMVRSHVPLPHPGWRWVEGDGAGVLLKQQ